MASTLAPIEASYHVARKAGTPMAKMPEPLLRQFAKARVASN